MLHIVIAVVLGAAAGYGFRGFINKEIKAASAKAETEAKADLNKL